MSSQTRERVPCGQAASLASETTQTEPATLNPKLTRRRATGVGPLAIDGGGYSMPMTATNPTQPVPVGTKGAGHLLAAHAANPLFTDDAGHNQDHRSRHPLDCLRRSPGGLSCDYCALPLAVANRVSSWFTPPLRRGRTEGCGRSDLMLSGFPRYPGLLPLTLKCPASRRRSGRGTVPHRSDLPSWSHRMPGCL